MQRIFAFLKAHKILTIIASLIIVYLLFSILAINPIAKRVVPWAANKYLNSQASVGSVDYDPFELSLEVKHFKLGNQADQTLTQFDRLWVDYELSGIFDWAWTFKAIHLSKPVVSIAYAKDGAFNWQAIIDATNKDKAPSKGGDMPRVVIKHIEIDQGHFAYEDANQPTPVQSSISPLNFSLDNFSTLPNKNGDYQIIAKLPEQEGEIRWGGTVTVKPLTTKGKVSLNHIDIPKVLALVKNLALPVTSRTGLADLAFDYDFSLIQAAVNSEDPNAAAIQPPASQHLALSNIALQLHDLNTGLISNTVLAPEAANRASTLSTALVDVKVPNITIDMAEDTALSFSELSATFEDNKLVLDHAAESESEPTSQASQHLLSIPKINVDALSFNLADNSLNIASIALEEGGIKAAIDAAGVLDWQQAFAQLGKTNENASVGVDGAADADEKTAKINTKQGDAAITNAQAMAQVATTDSAAPTEDMVQDKAAVAQAADEVIPVADGAVKPAFKLKIEAIGLNHWRAAFKDASFKQALSADVADINLAFKVNMAESAFDIADIHSEIGKLQAFSGPTKKAVATLNTIKLDKANIDLHAQKAAVGSIVATGLTSSVIHDQSGAVNWQKILAKAAQSPTATAQADASKVANKTADSTPTADAQTPQSWTFLLNTLALNQANIHIEEQSPEKPLVLDIAEGNIKLSNISQNLNTALPVHVGFTIKQGGKVAIDGKLQATPMDADLKVLLEQISLKPLASYINEHALLELNDGTTSINGQLALKQGKALTGAFKGGFSIDNLAVTEEEGSHDNFLSWDKMASDDLTVNIAPNSVTIGELSFIKPNSKFIIHEDKTLNITRMLRNKPDNTVKGNAQSKEVAKPDAPSDPFPALIKRIVFKDAALQFADLSLRPQFGADINTLSGAINGISSDPSAIAKVALAGKVDEYGSAKIKGELKPFKATDLMDIKLIFKNLEMSKLTPYSGKFAGRRIDSGKLSVDLDYKIKAHQLAGENKFVINKLKLGEKIESEDAADLPLDLAIAILEDNNGVIDLDLPVTGDLDNPEFNFGGIVWKAFSNIMTKIVTAPFKLLGSLLGGDGDSVESVVFEAGSSSLEPPELEKLKTVGEALLKRNKLQLTITPSYFAKADTRALQERIVKANIAKESGITLEAAEANAPVDLTNEATQKAVKALHDDLTDRGIFQKLGDRVNKPEADFYKKALEALITSTEITADDLQALATQRGEAVVQHLLEVGVDAGHMSLAKASEGKDEKALSAAFSIDAAQNAAAAELEIPADAANTDTQE